MKMITRNFLLTLVLTLEEKVEYENNMINPKLHDLRLMKQINNAKSFLRGEIDEEQFEEENTKPLEE